MYGVTIKFLNFFSIFFITLSLMSVLSAQTTIDGKLSVGDTSPTFFLRDINGEDFFLSDYVGEPRNPFTKQSKKKVVILSFFATWCKPCIKELPELQSISGNYSNDTLLTLLIDVNEKRDEVNKFLESLDIHLLVVLDRYGKISQGYNIISLPTLLIIDNGGIIRFISKQFKGVKEFRNILNAEITKVLNL